MPAGQRNLSSILEPHVSNAVRVRGEDLHARSLVDVYEGSADYAFADVDDVEPTEVILFATDDRLLLSCTCDAFRGQQSLCRHVWATVLEAQLAGLLSSLLSKKLIQLCPRDPNDLSEGAMLEIERLRSQARFGATDPESGWRRVLSAVEEGKGGRASKDRHESFLWRTQRRLIYGIDVTRSRADGGIALSFWRRDRKIDGSFGKAKAMRLSEIEGESLPDESDRRLIVALTGASDGAVWRLVPGESVEIPGDLEELVVPLLTSGERCFLFADDEIDVDHPILFDDGAPYRVELHVAPAEEEGRIAVTASFVRGSERFDAKDSTVTSPGGFVIRGHRIARFEPAAAFPWVWALQRIGSIDVPREHKDELLQRVIATAGGARVEIAPDLEVREVMKGPTPRLHFLRPPPASSREPIEAELAFEYDGIVVNDFEPGDRHYDPEERVVRLRNAEREHAYRHRLDELGFREQWSFSRSRPQLSLRSSALGDVVRALVAEGWRVDAEGKRYRAPSDLKLKVSSGVDWFDLNGTVHFDQTTVALPRILEQIRRGESVVRLDDGSVGVLPEDWSKRFGLLSHLGERRKNTLRFKGTQVGLLDLLLEEDSGVDVDEVFHRARGRVRRFSGIDQIDPPATFHGDLRSYQRIGLGWMEFLREFGFGGCLADDMGLGKTVQMIAHFAKHVEGDARALVIMPRSLIFHWRAEIARFAPHLRVVDHTGPARRRAPDFSDCNVVLTTYGTLVRDIQFLRQVEFEYVVLDEAQAIKNAATKTAKAARLLTGRHRLALSGTPLENHVGELWSLFEFLNPGMLGRSSAFAGSRAALRDPDPDTRRLLARALKPFFLRRTKDEVAKELPAKTEQILRCELKKEERVVYDELLQHYRHALLARVEDEGLDRSRMHVLEALLRLRQAACHVGLLDPARVREPSAKLELLLEHLEEVIDEGHKALVFSQFTSYLSIVRLVLEERGIAYEYLDGKTRDREEVVRHFQEDAACPVFLVSLKAGGLGLNLTAADYVFLLDPWWNPAAEAQAIDRTHRIGQTRAVFAYRLIARDTVEEKVIELQGLKRDLARDLIQSEGVGVKDLTREDLEMLLS